MALPGGPRPHHLPGGPGAPAKPPKDPVRDRPQDPGHGTPPSSGSGGGGGSHSPYRPGTGQRPPSGSGGGSGGTGAYQGTYRPPPAWVVRRNQILHRAGLATDGSGAWGPKSQASWKRFTASINTKQKQILASGHVPTGFSPYKGHLVNSEAVKAAMRQANAAAGNQMLQQRLHAEGMAVGNGKVPSHAMSAETVHLDGVDSIRNTKEGIQAASDAENRHYETLLGVDGFKLLASNRPVALHRLAMTAQPADLISMLTNQTLGTTRRNDVLVIQAVLKKKGQHVTLTGNYDAQTDMALKKAYVEQRVHDIEKLRSGLVKAYFNTGLAAVASIDVLGHKASPDEWVALLQRGGADAKALIQRAQSLYEWSDAPVNQMRQEAAQAAYVKEHGEWHDGPLSPEETDALLRKDAPYMLSASTKPGLIAAYSEYHKQQVMEAKAAAAAQDEDSLSGLISTGFEGVTGVLGWSAHEAGKFSAAARIFVYSNTDAVAGFVNGLSGNNLGFLGQNSIVNGLVKEGIYGGGTIQMSFAAFQDFMNPVDAQVLANRGKGILTPHEAWIQGAVTYDQWREAHFWRAAIYESVIDPLNAIGGIGVESKLLEGSSKLYMLSSRIEAGADRVDRGYSFAAKTWASRALEGTGDVMEGIASLRARAGVGFDQTALGRRWAHLMVKRAEGLRYAQDRLESIIARGAANNFQKAYDIAIEKAGPEGEKIAEQHMADLEAMAALPVKLRTDWSEATKLAFGHFSQIAPDLRDYFMNLGTSLYRTIDRTGYSEAGRVIIGAISERHTRLLIDTLSRELSQGDALKLAEYVQNRGSAYAGFPHIDLLDKVLEGQREYRRLIHDELMPMFENFTGAHQIEGIWDSTGKLLAEHQMGAEVQAKLKRFTGYDWFEFNNPKKMVPVANPMHGKEISRQQMERLRSMERNTRMGRYNDWAEHRISLLPADDVTGVANIQRSVATFRKKLDEELSRAYKNHGDGTWTDVRAKHMVPHPYARPGTEISDIKNGAASLANRRTETYLTKKMDDLIDSGLTNNKMRTHVVQLGERYKVKIHGIADADLARTAKNPETGLYEIWAPPITDAKSYYVALHEMAHAVLKHTGRPTSMAKATTAQWKLALDQEEAATRWAIEKMGVPITDDASSFVAEGLGSYYAGAKEIGNIPTPSDTFLHLFANPEQNLRDLISASNSISRSVTAEPLRDVNWTKYAVMIERKQVLTASAKNYLTPELLKEQGLRLEALANDQRAWARGIYHTVTFGLSFWKTASLPGHIAAYTIRNEVDNYVKMMLDGHVDPRRWFNPDGHSLFHRDVSAIKESASMMDSLYQTNVRGMLDSISHYFWANHRDLLDGIVGAHDLPPLPEEFWTQQRSFYENLVHEPDPTSLLTRFPEQRDPTKWEEWEGKLWDLMGVRPENYAKRATFYSQYTKALKRGATEDEAWVEAMEHVDKVLFDYSDMTVLESQLRVIMPFVVFWRKNAQFWAKSFNEKPWFFADAQRMFNAHSKSNSNEPDWMQRYLHIGTAGGVLRSLHADWLADWARDAYTDPMSFVSVVAFYRAFKQSNPNLPPEQQGWPFVAPLADAFASIGLGMNPFLRTAGEDLGVFNRRSWISIFPQSNLLQAFTETTWIQGMFGPHGSFYSLFPEQGFNWEQALQDPVLKELGMTEWQTLTSESFQTYVDREIANQVAHGQPADRRRAEKKIQSWFALQGIIAFVGGLYTRHLTDTDINFYSMQEMMANSDNPIGVFNSMTDQEQEAYQLEKKTVGPDKAKYIKNPQYFDEYRVALEGARTFYNMDDYAARQEYLAQHPEIMSIINPITSGHTEERGGWMRTQLLILQGDVVQHLYYDIIHNPEVDTSVQSASYQQLVTPELKRFWAQNDTPEQIRQAQIKGAYANYIYQAQQTYFAIPEKDQENRDSFLRAHPELGSWWADHNSMADDYAGIMGEANATFRDIYFRIVNSGDWDTADAFLKAHPYIFDFTSAEGRITSEGTWTDRSEAQKAYAAIAPELRVLYGLPADQQEAYVKNHPLLRYYFKKYGAEGTSIWEEFHGKGAYEPGGLSQHAKDYLAVKGLLDAFFSLPDGTAKENYLNDHPELRRYFAKYAGSGGGGSHGTSQHARDYMAIKPIMDAFFALSDADKPAYLAKHPELQKYFDKYGSHSSHGSGHFGGHVAADPEMKSRYDFWMKFFSLPPDERPAFVHNHAADAGIFVYGSLSYDDQYRKEMRWKREAIATGMSARATAYVHVKPLLDLYFTLKSSADKNLFVETNPELAYYLSHYAKHTGIPPKLVPLMDEYFKLPPYSSDRTFFLVDHPELKAYFGRNNTPEEKAMNNLVDSYFSLPYGPARDSFILKHPELGIWFDGRAADKALFENATAAFNDYDPRMQQFYKMYADIIPMDEIKRFQLAWTTKHPKTETTRIDRDVNTKGKRAHAKARSAKATGAGKKAGELDSRKERKPL